MARFADYPATKIERWLESRGGKVPSRRAWKHFTDFALDQWGDFRECGRYGGISGAPKLLAAISVIQRLRAEGSPVPATVGECLELAKDRGFPLGFLPPVDHAAKIARTAGRPDVARRLQTVGFASSK